MGDINSVVFVNIVDRYFVTGVVDWFTDEQVNQIVNRAKKLVHLLEGNSVPNLKLKDINGEVKALYDIPAKYTVMWFWDPNCGHCKLATPILKEVYEKYDRTQLEVYSVGLMKTKLDWLAYIDKTKLNWINVEDVGYKSEFRNYFDIFSTPLLILLDENKKIITKKITPARLDYVLQDLFK